MTREQLDPEKQTAALGEDGSRPEIKRKEKRGVRTTERLAASEYHLKNHEESQKYILECV